MLNFSSLIRLKLFSNTWQPINKLSLVNRLKSLNSGTHFEKSKTKGINRSTYNDMKIYFKILVEWLSGAGWNYNYYYKDVYLVNINSSEVHLISDIVPACNIDAMSEEHKLLMTKEEMENYEAHDLLNGCGNCFPAGSKFVPKTK